MIYCIGEILAVVSSTNGSLGDGESFSISTGGAEANVASNLAAHGYDVKMLSRVGDDPFGRRIVSSLDAIGVDISEILTDRDGHTGIYFKDTPRDAPSKMYYYRKDSAASRMTAGDFNHWHVAEGSWVFTSGITVAISTSCDQMIEHIFTTAKLNGLKIAFDINFRPALWDRDLAAIRLLELGSLCDVVFVGLDEADMLWCSSTPEQVAALFPQVSHVVI